MPHIYCGVFITFYVKSEVINKIDIVNIKQKNARKNEIILYFNEFI